MLQIRNLNYSIGDRQLLSGIDWVIRPGKRTALIGPNGAGKTTLLRILNNEIECPAGSISKPKIYRIGYLPQEEVALDGHSILQTVLDGQEEIKLLEKQIAQLHEALDADEVPDNMLNRLGDLEHQYEVLDGYHIESTAKSILSGLGFKESDLTRPLTEFSGGWRMRVYLAMLLVRKPDLLLMDEPTNHLDIPSIEWLEQYLLSFKGSMVLVSHDRFFIDRLAHEIVELDRGKLAFYSGNYHFFEKEKTLREALLQKQYKEQQLEISKQEKFINRFRYKSTKAAQVQSRIKLLDKMELITVAPPPPFLNFDLKVETSSYKDVLAIEDMSFKYDADWVLEKVNLNLYRGDKVSLVGVNGAGKTTLTRLIVEQLLPQLGSVKMGERVTVGYYAQHQVDTLNLEATAYEEIASTIATCHVPRIRDVLGVFQFRGDDVYKKIKVLSGGEKARVSLAKILLSPVNFLIMDEPTNHLDKISKDALEQALAQYNGTLLLISHDRYFLDKLVTRVFEIKDHHIREFDGNYSYYLDKRNVVPSINGQSKPAPILDKDSPSKDALSTDSSSTAQAGKKSKEQKRLEAEARQSISKEANILKKEVALTEEKIHELEAAQIDLEARLAQQETYKNSQLAVALQKEYGEVKKDLESYNERWEKAQIELDELTATIQ